MLYIIITLIFATCFIFFHRGKLATVEEAAENEEQLVFDGSPEGETRWLQ